MLNQFKARFASFLEPSRFIVRIVPPPLPDPIIQGLSPMFREGWVCEAGTLPGMGLPPSDTVLDVIPVRVATVPVYAEIELNFLVGGPIGNEAAVLLFFERWQSLIHDKDTHTVKYLDEYSTTIDINLLRRDQNLRAEPIYTVRLFKAYPSIVSPIPLSWGQSDEPMKQSVTFAYYQWERLGA